VTSAVISHKTKTLASSQTALISQKSFKTNQAWCVPESECVLLQAQPLCCPEIDRTQTRRHTGLERTHAHTHTHFGCHSRVKLLGDV